MLLGLLCVLRSSKVSTSYSVVLTNGEHLKYPWISPQGLLLLDSIHRYATLESLDVVKSLGRICLRS